MKVFWFGRFLFGGPNGQAKEPGFHESCCRFLIGGLDSRAQEPGFFLTGEAFVANDPGAVEAFFLPARPVWPMTRGPLWQILDPQPVWRPRLSGKFRIPSKWHHMGLHGGMGGGPASVRHPEFLISS